MKYTFGRWAAGIASTRRRTFSRRICDALPGSRGAVSRPNADGRFEYAIPTAEVSPPSRYSNEAAPHRLTYPVLVGVMTSIALRFQASVRSSSATARSALFSND